MSVPPVLSANPKDRDPLSIRPGATLSGGDDGRVCPLLDLELEFVVLGLDLGGQP
jgi:hypothetical protein